MTKAEAITALQGLVTQDLIDALEVIYPNKAPTEFMTHYELGVLVGQRQAVATLTRALSKNKERNRYV